MLLRLIYIANILVTGWISISCLFYPKTALHTVFENTVAYSESIRLVGALWGAIFVISILGLFYPEQMQVIFLFQWVYKSAWLLVVALPAIWAAQPYPRGMAAVFVLWVLGLTVVYLVRMRA